MSDGGRQPKRESKLSAWSPRKLFRSKSREPREEDNATSQDLIATSPLTQASNLPQIDGDGSSDGSNQVVQLSSLPLVPVASSNQSCEVPIEGEIVRSLSSSNGLATGGQLSTAWPAQGTVNISGGAFYKADNITLNTVNQNIQQVSQDPHPGLLSKVNETRDALQEERLFSRLQPSARAHYNFGLTSGEKKKLNRELCTPGTRKDVLEDIIDWVEDTSDTRGALYLLCGPAGSGKSTIACTIAHLFDTSSSDKHQIVGYLERTPTNKIPLGANFFCSRQFDDTNRVTAIAPTLAYQFALKSRPFADNLQDLDAVNHAVLSQLEKLLWKPLNEAISIRPQRFLLIIEAIDELGAEDSHLFLQSLIKLLQNDPLPGLKVFVTSREDTELVQLLDTLEPKRVYRLQDVEKKKVAEDISIYLTASLPNVDKPDLDATVSYSDGLFIIAATIVRYLAPHSKTPKIRARKLRALIANSAKSPLGLDAMDDLYSQILSNAIGEFSNDPDLFSDYLTILHIFLSSLVPISPSTAASLANPTADPDNEEVLCEIAADLLSRLHAVLSSDHEGKVLSYHKSFSDYIFDQKRSAKYYCDRTSLHARITASCFRILQSDLKFNIAGITSSFGLDVDIADLKDKVKANISPSLSYCCQYWSRHLDATDSTVTLPLHASLSSFLEMKALFWMEAMNLLGCQGRCDALLRKARDWVLRPSNPDLELAWDLAEAAAFALYFAASPASMSTPHLYISALATWAREGDAPSRWRRFFRQIPKVEYHGEQNRPLMEIDTGDEVWCVAISNDGTRIVSSGEELQVWDAATGGLIMTLDVASTDSVAISTDGTQIVSGSLDGVVRVWDASAGTLLFALEGHTDRVMSVAFSTDGTGIVSGSVDNSVRIWDVEGRTLLKKLEGHTAKVNSVAFSTDGMRVVSGSHDGSTRIWDVATESATILQDDAYEVVYSVALSKDGLWVAIGSEDGLVRVWEVDTGALLFALEGHTDMVLCVAFSSDGKWIVSASWDGTVRVWDAPTRSLLTTLKGHDGVSVTFSNDATRIVSSSLGGSVFIWDMWLRPSPKALEGHTDRILSVALSCDDSQIISGSTDLVAIWDVRTGALVKKLEGITDKAECIAFSTDGTRMVVGESGVSLQIWDLTTGTQLATMEGHTNQIVSVAFSDDGHRVVSGSRDKSARIWDSSTATSLAILEHDDEVASVAFSRDGSRVVSGSVDKSVRIWEVSTASLLTILEGNSGRVSSVALTLDGAKVVSVSENEAIRVWDGLTGVPTTTIGIPRGLAFCVAFSNDGTRIFFSVSGSIWVWDVMTKVPILTLDYHSDGVTSAVFSSDGRRILSGCWDGSLFLWDVQPPLSSAPTLPPYTPARWTRRRQDEDLKAPADLGEDAPRALDPQPRTGWLLSPKNNHDRLIYVPPTANLVPYPATLCISREPHSFLLPLDHESLGINWIKCYTP